MLVRFDDDDDDDDDVSLSLTGVLTPWLARAAERDGCSGRLLELPPIIVFSYFADALAAWFLAWFGLAC